MTHQVSFQTYVLIVIEKESYTAFADGNCWIREFKYGEDADGNRYEWVKELEGVEFGSISYTDENGLEVFIEESLIENLDYVKMQVFEYCKDRL